jgi:hypothetical protein
MLLKTMQANKQASKEPTHPRTHQLPLVIQLLENHQLFKKDFATRKKHFSLVQ